MDLLNATGITKRFANHTALSKVDLAVKEQSIFGLLGPNGAGKTTFIRIINQITAPDEGEVLLSGERLNPAHIHNIGYLPEERGLYKKMKVGEQALYLARLKGLSKQDTMKRLKYWFDKFEIGSWWNRKVEELSKGMQQKVQFIVTVIHEPKLLIFDEPFSGFDPINVNLLKEEILYLRDHGSTIIFSTHNMASVEELCDHIALINKSVKILDGKVKDIKKSYKSNIYEVKYNDYSGTPESLLGPGFTLLSEKKEEDLTTMTVRLDGNSGPNRLLSALMPHVQVHAFTEILPTINDIFIRKVNEHAEPQDNSPHE